MYLFIKLNLLIVFVLILTSKIKIQFMYLSQILYKFVKIFLNTLFLSFLNFERVFEEFRDPRRRPHTANCDG